MTPAQEGTYALKSLLPDEYINHSFFVDIGSGNTKIAWYENGKVETGETWGAKHYQKDIPQTTVYQEIQEIIHRIPAQNRKTCFIIGGSPYQMAKIVRKDKERFTDLRLPDYYRQDSIKRFKKEKFQCGTSIYKALYNTAQPDCVLFDWDANFSIGFLLDLKY